MRDPHGPGPESIERQLAARAGFAPSAGYRDRVLAGVRDALAGPVASAARPSGIDTGSRVTLVAMAISGVLVIVTPWLVMARAGDLLPAEPRFLMQARAAGIDLPVQLAAATRRPHETPLWPPGERFPERLTGGWRRRNLLTGDL